jgi:hypothetical protein
MRAVSIVEAVRRRVFNMKDPVQSQVNLCVIRGGQSDTGVGFPLSAARYHPTYALFRYILKGSEDGISRSEFRGFWIFSSILETLCFLVSRIPENGQSPKPQKF